MKNHHLDSTNGFNKFVVDIGQNLANNIEPPSENVTVENFLGNSNNQSIFLSSVEESEIIEIVENWKNKKYTGFDNIDMTIVKQVISHIVKAPVTPGLRPGYDLPKNGPIVERTYDWWQRSYDWWQRSWVIARSISVATRS